MTVPLDGDPGAVVTARDGTGPPAREWLFVVQDGGEVPGVGFYGLRRPSAVAATFPVERWPDGTAVHPWRLHGDGWEVLLWDVAVSRWPADWAATVRATLQRLIDAGCPVAWVGREGFFCDPPCLLTPEGMTEGVLAALTDDGDFRIAVHPDEPLAWLPDEDLLRLRARAPGLADAGTG